jgi:hypothetical protein
MNAAQRFPGEAVLLVTILERHRREPDAWTKSLVTTLPLDAALDLPIGRDRRIIIEEGLI